MQPLKKIYKQNARFINIFLQLVLLAVIFWLMAGRLREGVERAASVITELHWQLFAAVGLFTVAVSVSGLLWGQLLATLEKSHKISALEAVRVHILSWLLKYVPGQAGSFLTKVIWAKNKGASQRIVLASLLYENIFLASSSVILSVPFLGVAVLSELGNDSGLILPLLLTLSVLPLLIPAVFRWLLQTGLRLTKRKTIDKDNLLEGREVVKNQLLFLVPRLINGFGFALIVSIFFPPGLLEFFQLSGAYVLAGIIGILAFFVPSGLGVREAVIIVAAGPIIGLQAATASAILARVCATIADGILALIYGGIRLSHGKRN